MRVTTELFDFRRETQSYLVLGPLAVILNIPVVLIIASSEALRVRKEFIMIAGFCLVDAIYGVSFVLVAVYRLELLDQDRENELTSRVFCSRILSQGLMRYADQLLSCIVLVNSVDRFVAVFRPIAYYKLTSTYSWLNLAFVFVQAGILYLLSALFTLDDTAVDVSILCFTYHSVDKDFYIILQTTRIASVSLSILLYIPVMVKLFFYTKTQNVALRTRLKQLKRTTITVALATSTDTIFILIPDVVLALNVLGLQRHAMVFYILHLSKCTVNIVICVVRHKEITMAISSRFKSLQSRLAKTTAYTITTF